MHGHPVRVPSGCERTSLRFSRCRSSKCRERWGIAVFGLDRTRGGRQEGEEERGRNEGEQEDLHRGDGDSRSREAEKISRPPRVRPWVRARFRIFMRYITYSGKWHVTWFTGTDNGGIKRARADGSARFLSNAPFHPLPRSPCRATSTHARTHACARVTLSAF